MILAFDTETELIRPGKQVPSLVCMTYQEHLNGKTQDPGIIWQGDSEAAPVVRMWLLDNDVTLVGHNVAFDMAVIGAKWPDFVPLIFEKYERGLITDTMIRQQLLDIAAGCFRGRMGDDNKWIKYGYTLDDVCHRARGSRLRKDGWRLAYSFFLKTPLEDWNARAVEVQAIARGWLKDAYQDADKKWQGPWPDAMTIKDVQAIIDDDPAGARTYPLEDARATLDVHQWQEPHAADWLRDQYRQASYAFAMHLSSVHGIRTHKAGVDEFERATREDYEEAKAELIRAGLVRPDGTRNMKAAMQAMVEACDRLQIPMRLTEGGKPSLEKDACDLVDDPVIKEYSAFQTYAKVLSNDVPMLRSGCTMPIHPRYGLADTGRSTCTGPNIQALRRKKGIREAFIPRAGKVFAQADYEGLELHTLAQACFTLVGHSTLGEALNAGRDPHSEVAARILGVSYEEIRAKIKDKTSAEYDARQAGKVCNFGFPVGLGPDSLVLYARKTYGVSITREQAVELKRVWLEQWPEMGEYFNYVSSLMGYDNVGMVEQLYVKRFRGNSRYTSACSSFSQGLGGDCAKNAMWLVARAQYTDRSSLLFGTRTVAFVHDEIIIEVPDDATAHDRAQELGKLMLQGANKYLTEYPARIEPLIMAFWSKNATPIYDDNHRLLVWGR